jgi:hypothetical protein
MSNLHLFVLFIGRILKGEIFTMSKKTLNEATIRQFMKLVNHKPATISSFIKENYNEEQELEESASVNEEDVKAESMYEEEGEDMDAEMPPAPELDAELDAEMSPEEGEEGVGDLGPGGELDITPDMAQALIEFGQMLAGAMGDELAGEEPVADEIPEPVGEPEEGGMDAELPPEEGEEDMLENDKPSLSEEEVVQEVARRVAKRILKAKRAQKEINEAAQK